MTTSKITKSTENQPVCVSFYRVSTDKQTNIRQISDVRKYVKAYNWNLVKEFQETISGASKLSERKELKQMLKYVEENKVDYVICSELSRLARSQDALTIIKDWTDKGICFISLKENIKTLNEDGTQNPMTNLLLGILNSINIFEIDTIKYRIKSGLNKTVNTGVWSGRSPYGFTIVDKRLVINHDEVETVKFIFSKYSEGWGSHRIASHLNINNITTKENKRWVDTKVYKILSNQIYTGKRLWNGEIISMSELKIVDESTFTNVQDRLSKKTNTTTINKQQKNDYLLQNKILCGCGRHFIGQARHNIYMCASKKYSGSPCTIKPVKIDWFDEEIKKRLMVNSGKLLFDNSGVINKTKEMQDEILILQSKIDEEKVHQNYLINNISKIGQKKFDEKFDASTEFVNTLQEKVDVLNVKISNSNTFIKTPPAVAIINPEFEHDILSGKKEFGMEIFQQVIIDKELIQKVIETINIDNDGAVVRLINGKEFSIVRPTKKNNLV